MGNTPLLTVRCPDDLMESIASQVASTDRTKTEVVVEMLRNSVPSVRILERNKLPESPAIYFVITPDNRLLYIGQSKNLRQRWQSHHRFQQFIEASQETRVVWFEFDESDRQSIPSVEEELITLLDTEYNETDVPLDENHHIKRCAFRVPIDLYNEIEKIAVEEYNAPTYHKTGKPQVSSTIIQLLRLGIENLRGEVSDNKPDTIPDTDLDEKIAHAIGQLGINLIANLKSDEEFLKAIALRALAEPIALEVQKISTVAKEYREDLNDNVTEEAEIEEYEDETITQIDKASLAPIFEDEDSEEVDFNSCTVSHLRRIVTLKGLGKKFREKLGKYPGNAKKAEIVKFLNETSIFDLD